jgi:hypothetical protein
MPDGSDIKFDSSVCLSFVYMFQRPRMNTMLCIVFMRLAVCCASRIKSQKIDDQVIFTVQTAKAAPKLWFL